jgi:hypothetical protein
MTALYFFYKYHYVFLVHFIVFFVQEGIPRRLNLAHSKLLPETCRRCAVDARQLSNWLHQKSTPIQTDQRPLETLKKIGRKTSRLTSERKVVSRLCFRHKFNIILCTLIVYFLSYCIHGTLA